MIEVRSATGGGVVVSGSFPYNRTSLVNGTRERFSPHALTPGDDTVFIVEHDFSRPLARADNGTLTFTQGDDELRFDATISPAAANIGHVRDTITAIQEGLLKAVSPRFNRPLERRINGVRVIDKAQLLEMSVVTRPAYDKTTAMVEMRSARRKRGLWL